MAERCGLFMIIALGESILVTGSTFSKLAWTVDVVAAFIVSLIGSMAMWWLYFSNNAGAASERFASASNPGKLARLAYTYLHLPLVMGVIVSAVADELVLAHPLGHTGAGTACVILGSMAIYLIGNAVFKWAIWKQIPWMPFCGAAVLAAVMPFHQLLPPLALLGIATLTIVAVAVQEGRTCRACPG